MECPWRASRLCAKNSVRLDRHVWGAYQLFLAQCAGGLHGLRGSCIGERWAKECLLAGMPSPPERPRVLDRVKKLEIYLLLMLTDSLRSTAYQKY